MGLWSVVGAGEDHVDFVPKGGGGAVGTVTKHPSGALQGNFRGAKA
jgi:hypothetical protein